MENQQGDYEYYTREDNTMKYIVLTAVIIMVAGIIIWLLFKNRDLSTENQRLNAGQSTYTQYEQNAVAPVSQPVNVSNPNEDLKVNFEIGSNLVDVPIIKGSVFNASGTTAYKNVVLSVSYYTEGYDLIGRENITATYMLQPGQIAEVRHKPEAKAYRKARHIQLQLLEATAE